MSESAPTIRDVARKADVAVGTVSRVIRGDPTVHKLLRQSVEAAIAELGYRPSPLATHLRTGKTAILGLAVNDLRDPLALATVPVAQELARAAGYTLLVADAQMDRDVEQKNIQRLMDLRVAGILWSHVRPDEKDRLDPGNIPVVSMTGPHLLLDNGAVLLPLVDELVHLGHRKVALLTHRGYPRERELMGAMVDKLKAAGGRFVSDASWTVTSREEGHGVLDRSLRSPGRPTALIVVVPLLAEALTVIRECGLQVPGDISVIAYGDSDLARAYNPPIDVLAFDYARYARTALEILLEMVSTGEDVLQPAVIPTHHERRGSVARAPGVAD